MVHARRDERSSAHLYPQEEEEDRQERRMLVDYRYLNQVHAPPQLSRCYVCRKTLAEHRSGRWCRRSVRPIEADRPVSTLQLTFPLQDGGLQSLLSTTSYVRPHAGPAYVRSIEPRRHSAVPSFESLGWDESLRPIVDDSFMAFVARALTRRSLGRPSQLMNSIEPEPERSVKGSVKGSEVDCDSGAWLGTPS